MLTQNMALLNLANGISSADLSLTAAALQKQATRDLGPIWGIQATINAFPDINSVPVGYWPIYIVEESQMSDPNDEGYHWSDENHLPYSIVKFDPGWQLTCSHEMCEMLVDPYGNKTVTSDSIDPGQGRVNYLLEVCDPCEAAGYCYTVNGILVSDFYTPDYFDPVTNSGEAYSFTGALSHPKQVLSGGYLTWNDPATGNWYQADAIHYNPMRIIDITAKMPGRGPLRSRVDRVTKNERKLESIISLAEKSAVKKALYAGTTKQYQSRLEDVIYSKLKPPVR